MPFRTAYGALPGVGWYGTEYGTGAGCRSLIFIGNGTDFY